MADFTYDLFTIIVLHPGTLIASFIGAFILSLIFGAILAITLKYIFKKTSILGYRIESWVICGFITVCFFDLFEIIKVLSGVSQDLVNDISMIVSFSFLLVVYLIVLILKKP